MNHLIYKNYANIFELKTNIKKNQMISINLFDSCYDLPGVNIGTSLLSNTSF